MLSLFPGWQSYNEVDEDISDCSLSLFKESDYCVLCPYIETDITLSPYLARPVVWTSAYTVMSCF